MNLDIYKTTVCKGYNLNKIYSAIKVDLINHDYLTDLVVNSEDVKGIKQLSGEANEIPPFSHPLIVNNGEKDCVVIDIRRLIKRNSDEKNDYNVAVVPDYNFITLRARILYVGVTGDADKLRDFDPLPATIFARWITNALTFKLNLNSYEQNVLTVLTIGYYFKLFDPELNVIELMMFINRNTYISPDIISEIFDIENINEKIKDLAGYVDLIKEKIPNVRIENLSVPLLLSSLTYGWRGSDAKETMAICLEHPPTWIACLTTAIADKNFRHSPIAKIVKNYTKQGNDKDFLMRLETLLADNERDY